MIPITKKLSNMYNFSVEGVSDVLMESLAKVGILFFTVTQELRETLAFCDSEIGICRL